MIQGTVCKKALKRDFFQGKNIQLLVNYIDDTLVTLHRYIETHTFFFISFTIYAVLCVLTQHYCKTDYIVYA